MSQPGCDERDTMATLLFSVLPPPRPSSCSGSEAPMAPISAWSRASSPSGNHSRRKKGPREVPARISTQGMDLFISIRSDLGGLNHLLPLDLLLRDIAAHLVGGHGRHLGTMVFQALDHALVGEHLIEHLVELFDHGLGRLRRREDAI